MPRRPPADMFCDPPFAIERPGAWVRGRPRALRALLPVGFDGGGHRRVDRLGPGALRSTRDGTLWWGQVPLASVASKLNRSTVQGALYKYVLNQVRPVRDPVDDRGEDPDPEKASRLVIDRSLHRGPSEPRRQPPAAG